MNTENKPFVWWGRYNTLYFPAKEGEPPDWTVYFKTSGQAVKWAKENYLPGQTFRVIQKRLVYVGEVSRNVEPD
jgi:hypothetical protein